MMKNYNDSNKNNDIMIPLVKCVMGETGMSGKVKENSLFSGFVQDY